jgi:hypothetical protein
MYHANVYTEDNRQILQDYEKLAPERPHQTAIIYSTLHN